MNRARMIVAESVRSLTANLSTTLAATMTVLIGMFLVGLAVALGSWMYSWSEDVKSKLEVKIYFSDDATAAQINAVRARLDSRRDLVKSVEWVSKDEALARMKKRFPELTEELVLNPLPASLEVLPRRGEDVQKVSALVKPLPPGVDRVRDGEQTSRRILRVAGVIEGVIVVAVLVLLIASTLLIANTIRLSIFSRRREIEVMKLVGATNWFVRGPFMLEGLLCGLVGAVAAILLLLLGKELALPNILGRINSGSEVEAWPFVVISAILLGLGLVLGAAGSGLTLRRFLRI